MEELVRRLEALGATLRVENGEPRLQIPPGTLTPRERADLQPQLILHRQAVLDYFRGSRSSDLAEHCGECKGFVYHEDAFLVCGRPMCPWWRAGMGPDWIPGYRNREEWKRRGKA